MKLKVLYILAIVGLMSFSTYAQKGVRIGYIDTEFILQNVQEYKEASTQLESKLGKWKAEIEKRLAEVETQKKSLENEKVLLTKELYEERLEDISFEESEVLDYQQKRFGPNGDMIIQRTQLIQPIQDQIYAAVKEIAENKKYDFVFDKNADFLMLYSDERFDISDQVLRIITRAADREQIKNKRDRKALEEEDVIPIDESDAKDERTKAIEERNAKRKADLEERRRLQKEARDARLEKVREARTEKNDTITDATDGVEEKKAEAPKVKTAEEKKAEIREKALKERNARKKALDEQKRILTEQRKKIREDRLEQLRKNDSIRKAKEKKENN